MKSKTLIVLAAAIVVAVSSGCASTHMKRFIGRDVRYVSIEDGAPVNVFDLLEGRRAFQFTFGGGTIVVPKTTTTNGQIQMVGNSAYYSEQKIESGGQTIATQGCLVTYIAAWDADRQGWIVREIAYPHRMFC